MEKDDSTNGAESMYIPEKFKGSDLQEAFNFCDHHGFATVVSNNESGITANHFPLILDRTAGSQGTLLGHMAKGNPQWKHWNPSQEVLCIFSGPDHYISPSWYQDPLNVPTWNYAVVHVIGTPRLIESHEGIEIILSKTVNHYEGLEKTGWKYELPEDFKRGLTKAIIGFEIEIKRIEIKFKLSQNRSDLDRESVIRALELKAAPESLAMAEMMKEH